jgi:hypothetical protein
MKSRFAKSDCFRMTPKPASWRIQPIAAANCSSAPAHEIKNRVFPLSAEIDPGMPRNPLCSPARTLTGENSFHPSRKVTLAILPAAQSPLDFSREPSYGLVLQPIPKLKVFAIVNMEKTEAPAFRAPEFAPTVPRKLCTNGGTRRTHARCGCAEVRANGFARNPSKPLEHFWTRLAGRCAFAPAWKRRLYSSCLILMCNVGAGGARDSTGNMAFQTLKGNPRQAAGSSIRDEEMLAIAGNS